MTSEARVGDLGFEVCWPNERCDSRAARGDQGSDAGRRSLLIERAQVCRSSIWRSETMVALSLAKRCSDCAPSCRLACSICCVPFGSERRSALSAKSSNSFESATLAIVMRGLTRWKIVSAPLPRFPGKPGFVVGVGAVVAIEVVEPLAGASGACRDHRTAAHRQAVRFVAPLPANVPVVLPLPPDPV